MSNNKKGKDNKRSNKKMWYTLASLGVIIVAVAGGLFISGAVGASKAVDDSGDVLKIKPLNLDDSGRHAQKLFDARVDDINDTAAVAELLETMELESVTGEYTVEIAEEDGIQVLSLTISKPMEQIDKSTFDENMEKCAQQMMVLIPQIEKVQWTYPVINTGKKEEATVASLDKQGAAASLGNATEFYGKSAERVKEMLESQSGKSS